MREITPRIAEKTGNRGRYDLLACILFGSIACPLFCEENATNAQMKLILLTLVTTTGLMLFWPEAHTAGQPKKNSTAVGPARAKTAGTPQTKLLATRMMLIDRKKALREQLQKSMPLHEEAIRSLSADYETKKDLYEKNLISKSDLENSERDLAIKRLDAERVREWIAEDDRALSLTEEAADEELYGTSRAALVRYDGGANWSLAGLEKVRSFFRQRFGRSLPISAIGQSDTHDRLGLDHRRSVDVALRPDSAEGRDLMIYLRRSGIPFIAFHGKLSSMSTGAHIHIGRPSPRLIQVKQHASSTQPRRDGAEHG